MKDWERRVLENPGAAERVAEIEDELRLAVGLTALRERAGLSQRDLASRMRVSQPRVVAIERSKNVTISVLEQYVDAIGGRLEVAVKTGGKRFNLLSPRPAGNVPGRTATKSAARKVAPAKAAKVPVGKAVTGVLAPAKETVGKKTGSKPAAKTVRKTSSKPTKQAARPRVMA
jgi:transcriptional regulator with XRE-family HTH domain